MGSNSRRRWWTTGGHWDSMEKEVIWKTILCWVRICVLFLFLNTLRILFTKIFRYIDILKAQHAHKAAQAEEQSDSETETKTQSETETETPTTAHMSPMSNTWSPPSPLASTSAASSCCQHQATSTFIRTVTSMRTPSILVLVPTSQLVLCTVYNIIWLQCCMLLPKKLESTLDYNFGVKYIFVQFHMAEQECMTLPTLPTPSNMHCIPCFYWFQSPLKFRDLTVGHLNSGFDLNG